MHRNRHSCGPGPRTRREERRIAWTDWHETASSAPPDWGARRRAYRFVVCRSERSALLRELAPYQLELGDVLEHTPYVS
jgi:hypothetical protein